MQAVWGQEKGAPTPVRGAELYGEVGRWKVSTAESIPGIYTGAEDPNKRWASPSKRRVPVTSQSTKRPPEMDVAPVGVKVAIGSKPDVMHMANHDHGVVWPPTAPRDMAQVPFRAMQKEKPDHAPSVNGVMVGYTGHVPRSRDKVGGCPLGGVPGRPGVRSAAPDDTKGLVQSSNAVAGRPEPTLYVSEAHDPQGKGLFQKPKNPVGNQGHMPGYAGHVHRARYTVGFSTAETEDTKRKIHEYADWEHDEWRDGDLSEADERLIAQGYAAPGGNNEDAHVPEYLRR